VSHPVAPRFVDKFLISYTAPIATMNNIHKSDRQR
jgi:hypothetical protein